MDWFNVWSASPFDPYPFTFLTLVVSLEAILLTSFVLAAQDRMTREANRRDKLDLQVDMLAEQELTAILRGIGALAEHSRVDLSRVVPNLAELTSDTRIELLARRLADVEMRRRDSDGNGELLRCQHLADATVTPCDNLTW